MEERKRIKREEVSEETRSGHKRAAVNPNARKESVVTRAGNMGKGAKRAGLS